MIKTRIDTSSKHLSKLMGALDLSVDELAEVAGVHRTTAYRWLGRHSYAPVAVIRMLELMAGEKK